MNAFQRRGACPALSTPMQTGDGLLVRLNPVAGGLSPKALIGLAESATRHGNGIMEVTARGSIQIRGLTTAGAGQLATEVNALGIAVRTGVPVETGPLAGLDMHEIADPRPLAVACAGRLNKPIWQAGSGRKSPLSSTVAAASAWTRSWPTSGSSRHGTAARQDGILPLAALRPPHGRWLCWMRQTHAIGF
ncbi:hypothetical protein [Mesorhizobium amorphae]|uniref:hypothetical protein n=1 Tax=Mesorhizobium amorphae TaxID=71433 RepID=UPI0028CB17CE|nr:hypothetical protein [Mesorhizobium amorphae]